MTSANDNDTNQLEFLHQTIEHGNYDVVSDDEVISSIRLRTAWFLNRRAADLAYKIPAQVATAIKGANEIALKNGRPPLLSDEELLTLD